MIKPVRKIVIPVAGLGTRVLPATKSIAKELLPVVDRPLIDYVVAEAKAAGLEDIIFVTGRGKGAIEDYFDHSFELEATLRDKGKTELLDSLLDAKPAAGSVSYTRQQAPLGLGMRSGARVILLAMSLSRLRFPMRFPAEAPGLLPNLSMRTMRSGETLSPWKRCRLKRQANMVSSLRARPKAILLR